MEQAIEDFLNSGAILSHQKADGSTELVLAWGNPSPQASPSANRMSVYAPDYFLTAPLPWITYDHWITLDKVNLHRLLLPWAVLFMDEVEWQAPKRSEFQQDYDELQQRIRSGELTKGVPYVFEQGAIHTVRAWRARTLLYLVEQAKGHIYGLWNENEGLLGATPETLFQILPGPGSFGELRTMALAGTQDICEDAQDFLRDAKQIHEHRVVVDDIIERLHELGNVSLLPMRVLELPRMRHLLTEIRVHLRVSPEGQFERIARLLHPTPALGAAPRPAGWEWLKKLQQLRPRHRFGAPFGMSYAGVVEICLVAIRNVQWAGDQLWLGAGCGVVAQSRFDDEWDELTLKRESTKRMLGL